MTSRTRAHDASTPTVKRSGESSILIADDDPLFLKAMTRFFRGRGFQVRTAGKYEEALALVDGEPPDFAVVDLRIEDRSGLDILERLKSVDPDTRVVMVSAYASIPTAIQAIQLGAVDFISKPADGESLLSALVSDQPASPVPDYHGPSLARAEWEHINRVIADCGGNITKAARELGIHRRSLQRKLKKPPPRR